MEKRNYVRDGLLGLSVGDALGLPVEFHPRFELDARPVKGMRAFGTWKQPAGTWSDDSSLSFCLADSLCSGYDLVDIGDRFLRWKNSGLWTPYGVVFDIGSTTKTALERLEQDPCHPTNAGLRREDDNRNGSLMRILPIAFWIRGMEARERWRVVADVSAITHAHIRAVISCVIYCEIALGLMSGLSPNLAYREMKDLVLDAFKYENEITSFNWILTHDLAKLKRDEVKSSCNVVESLEASLWCLLSSHDFAEASLKAVNLGEDTDTIGALTGGLAALAWGEGSIPPEWLSTLARRQDIEALADRLSRSLAERRA